MEFTCPTCDVSLQAQMLEDIRLWKCTTCRGIAISLPLVRKSLSPETFKKFWQKLSTGEARSGRSCPGCRHPLNMVEAGGPDGAIMIDICRTCHILWFDDKEFSDLSRVGQEKKLTRALSAEENLAIAAFKADQYKRRSFLLKLLDIKDPEDLGFGSVFGGFFNE